MGYGLGYGVWYFFLIFNSCFWSFRNLAGLVFGNHTIRYYCQRGASHHMPSPTPRFFPRHLVYRTVEIALIVKNASIEHFYSLDRGAATTDSPPIQWRKVGPCYKLIPNAWNSHLSQSTLGNFHPKPYPENLDPKKHPRGARLAGKDVMQWAMVTVGTVLFMIFVIATWLKIRHVMVTTRYWR